jgi:GTPase
MPGLVGLPNAGKSTFLAATSNAAARRSPTTPSPRWSRTLAWCGIDGTEEFVLADIPGLIEGASEGRGLGDQFLGHVERCAVLLHLVDGTSSTITKDYKHHPGELKKYSPELADKPRMTVLNKIDALWRKSATRRRRAGKGQCGGKPLFVMSGVSGKGLPEVLRALRPPSTRAACANAVRPRRGMPWEP